METQQTPNMGQPTPSQSPTPGGFMSDIENFFDEYLHKKVGYHLPQNVKEFIVKYSPYISLIMALIALPLVLGLLSIGAVMTPVFMAARVYLGPGYYIHGAIALITLVMYIIAFAPLKARKMSGWRMLYYAALLDAVGNIISMDIVGLILGLAISMYFLFQVREYYK